MDETPQISLEEVILELTERGVVEWELATNKALRKAVGLELEALRNENTHLRGQLENHNPSTWSPIE